MARTNIRASAIIIRDDKVLLMHRKKNGLEYWVLPGGHLEDEETGDEAIKREVKEETNLICTRVIHAFDIKTFEGGITHPFYYCDVEDGKPVLGGPEAKRQSSNNWYRPEWVYMIKVKEINLLPDAAKSKLLEILKKI